MMKVLFNADGTMSVTLGDGTSVGTPSSPGTAIPAGLYDIHLDDTAGVLHLFHLVGPGVYVSANPLTDGPDGEAVLNEFFEVTFQPNSTYTYQDDYSPNASHRVFSTTGGAAPAHTPVAGASTGKVITGTSIAGTKDSKVTAPAAPVRFRGSLAAAISASGKPNLTFKGKNVTTLQAGRYRISIVDQSKTSGFIIQQFHKLATTVAGASFTGRRTVTIVLKPGQWLFYPTFVGRKTYFVVTA
jgi:hypothetical protein